MKLTPRLLSLLVPLAVLLAPAVARAQIQPPPIQPPQPIVIPETERVLWSVPGSAYLQIRTRLWTTTRQWSYSTHWSAIGVAGNRLLWQRTDTGETNLWKLDDAGNYVSHAALTTPGPAYRARSITLANTFVGSCYDRRDTQRYHVLWVDNAGARVLDLVEGSGLRNASYVVDPLAGVTQPTAVVGVYAALGGPQMLTHVTPAGQTARFEIRFLNWTGTRFTANSVAAQYNLASGYVPVSMNARESSVDGWTDQVFTRVSVGSGSLWNIGWDRTPPSTGPYWIGETFYPYPSQGWQAKAHTVNPAMCP